MRQSSLQATRAAAASALPPASPAATGIRFLISISTAVLPRGRDLAALASAVAARAARFAWPPGTDPAPVPVTTTVVRSAGRTVTSSKSETA